MSGTSESPNVDIVIITIKVEEFKAVLSEFQSLAPLSLYVSPKTQRHYNLRMAEAGNGNQYYVAIVRQTEQGNAEALATARDAIDDFAPRLVVVVGIAGGAPSSDVSLGDVVISTRINDYTIAAVRDGKPAEYSIAGGRIDSQLVKGIANLGARPELANWAQHLPPAPKVVISRDEMYGSDAWKDQVERGLNARFGPERKGPCFLDGHIGSSDTLIKEPDRLIEWLATARNLRAVEMESAGIYRAAEGKVLFLAIRGLSDIVGFNRSAEWTDFACKSAAAFTKAYLTTTPIEVVRATPSAPASSAPPPPAQFLVDAAERLAASRAFQAITKLIDLVDRWKSPSAMTRKQFEEGLEELWPTLMETRHEVSLRMPDEFEWLFDSLLYFLSQIRASDDSHKMYQGVSENGSYAREVVEEFTAARVDLPKRLTSVWALFRASLKDRANGMDVRVSNEPLDQALGTVVTTVARVPNGSLEMSDNSSLQLTASRLKPIGLEFTRFGGKLILKPKRIGG